jgi:2'-5' RNA ligase
MQGIVAILDGASAEAVRRLVPAAGHGALDTPHLTFAAASAFDLEHTEAALKSIARSVSPFATRTAGLGLFTGPDAVLYAAVVRTSRLNLLHRSIHQEALKGAAGLDPLYDPEQWVPHLTIARGASAPNRLAALASVEVAFAVPIATLAVVEATGEGGRICFQFALEG